MREEEGNKSEMSYGFMSDIKMKLGKIRGRANAKSSAWTYQVHRSGSSL